MLILAIESSCDETAIALLESDDGMLVPSLLSSVISTQIPIHRLYGGVIPELASRNHSAALRGVLEEALTQADRRIEQVDAFAGTAGPGLVAALLIGNSAAKALALAAGKPYLAINHMEGHLLSPFITHPGGVVPHIGLVVSGGHTLLIHVKGHDDYELLGRSLDDAAGEAFDKAAKMLNLPYPGGPEIDRLARLGDPARFSMPRPMMHEPHHNFSFSGLKTALLYTLPKVVASGDPRDLDEQTLTDLCASVQQAIIDVLVRKSLRALSETGMRTLALSGGVSCNRALREHMTAACEKAGVELILPAPEYTTDNAAMIAYAALLKAEKGEQSPLTTPVDPNMKLSGLQVRA